MCCCFQWCTDVILVIRHYPNLCRDTCFVTGADKKHRNTTCPNLQRFGFNEGCISPWFPYTIRRRHHWTICWQGKADFFRVLAELDPDNYKVQALSQLEQNIYLKHPLMSLKHLSVSYICLTQKWLMEQVQVGGFSRRNRRNEHPPASLHPAIMQAQSTRQWLGTMTVFQIQGYHNSLIMARI